MNSRPDIHPSWCGQGHVCSADRPGGEHRSSPRPLDTHTARLVITRTSTIAGRNRIELRAVIDLPADPIRAEETARRAVLHILQVLGWIAEGDRP